MKIAINGETYEVPDYLAAALLESFKTNTVELYRRQNEEFRFLLKPIARWFLSKMETALKPRFGKERAAEVCRPPKKGDPVLHMIEIERAALQGMTRNAVLTIETTGNTATAFNLELPIASEGGGPLAPYGYIGIRENNGAEIP